MWCRQELRNDTHSPLDLVYRYSGVYPILLQNSEAAYPILLQNWEASGPGPEKLYDIDSIVRISEFPFLSRSNCLDWHVITPKQPRVYNSTSSIATVEVAE